MTHHFSHLFPPSLSRAALSESATPESYCGNNMQCIARSVCWTRAVYGDESWEAWSPYRAALEESLWVCVCPQQSKTLMTLHPPRTTPVTHPLLHRMQFEVALLCLRACVRPCMLDGIAAGIGNMGNGRVGGSFGVVLGCWRQPCAHVPSCAARTHLNK